MEKSLSNYNPSVNILTNVETIDTNKYKEKTDGAFNRKFDTQNRQKPVMALFFAQILYLCIAYMRIL